jgi:carboxypeptidase C (cathepsin A)
MPWSVGGQQIGLFKSLQTLTFLKVTGGGHMTPHDVPEAALQLFNQFIFNVSFAE